MAACMGAQHGHAHDLATVLECFTDAVSTYGLPLRVRVTWEEKTLELHSSQPEREASRIIMGCSVHNQRIERLWRDVFQGCISLYYQLFTHLETGGLLDPCSEVHVFALHFVYLLHIQRSLDYFCTAYIHHPISSCHNIYTSSAIFYWSTECSAKKPNHCRSVI